MSQYDQLTSHVEQVGQGLQTLNIDLLDSFRLTGVQQLSAEQSRDLAARLYRLLPSLQQDPAHVCQLLEALLEPWPLETILQIEPPVDFTAGLNVHAGPFNTLTLSLLQKGLTDIAAARRLATTQPAVFTALLELWLRTEDAGIAMRAGLVILGLLKADRELDGSGLLPEPGEDPNSLTADNPLWRRIFRDPDVYAVLYTSTDLNQRAQGDLSKGQVTVAQARLIEFLPKIAAMDWNSAARSHVPSVESAHGLQPGQGLIFYAAVLMVDLKNDVLLHRSLINFYADLLQSHSESYQGSSSISPPLAFLLDNALHQRTLSIYTNPEDPAHDPLDITFLYAAAAQYLSTYVTSCYRHFMESNTKDEVVVRLDQVLNVPPSHWHNSPPSGADLHVLASLPRPLLLSYSGASSSPLKAIPTRPANADAFKALASVFHGPVAELTFPARDVSSQDKIEMSAARQLYLDYLLHNTRVWADVTSAADTVAMQDVALAAVSFVSAIASANWPSAASPTDADGDASMLDDESSRSVAHMTGIEALLVSETQVVVLPWLLRAPQRFSGLVGGRGDAEGAAYRVATVKFDCLQVVEKRLLEWMAVDGPEVQRRRGELERIAHALRERVSEGVWGARGDVGGRIATLEL